MKLHLGCGKRDFGSAWVHIDQCEFPHVTHKDVTKLPFADGSCDLIYASHLLEYFDREEATHVLREWYRVLGRDGILRLAVPDFDALCTMYMRGSVPLENILGPLYGKWGDPICYHKTVYDFVSLYKVLGSVGFTKIHKYDWTSTDHSHIDDHSQAYMPHMDKENGKLISLNVVAVK
jgi:predicted SAM-dependent methyltransferase